MRFHTLAGAALAALLIAAAQTAPAFAHAELETAVPAIDSATAAPTELRLGFSEELELVFTTVAVTGADGAMIPTGTLALDPADSKILIVPLSAPLAGGAVHVDWKAVAVDGHKSEGSYNFTVTP
jgi:methionine-rich copper-binding protein CopC